MTDWEDEDFDPAPPALKVEAIKNKWADEDAEEEEVKDSWEDEEEPAQASKPAPAVEKSSSKPNAKASGKKGKQAVSASAEVDNDVLADPLAEKLRQQRLVEESDFSSTKELFGKKGDEKTLDNFIPKTEADFQEYAELIAHKLHPYQKSFHYVTFLKSVLRLSTTLVSAAGAKEIASSVTAIANEKLKVEKEIAGGKKKTGAAKNKRNIKIENKDDDYIPNAHDAAQDDFDFM